MAKPVVIVVGADKGGVGKTTVSRTLLDYFETNNVPTRAFDTESPRGTLKRFHPDVTEIVDMTTTSDQMKIFDTLNAAAPSVTVIDVRAGLMSPALASLRDIGFLDAAKSGQITFAVFHMLGPSIASLDEIAETANFMQGAKYFLVKNFVNDIISSNGTPPSSASLNSTKWLLSGLRSLRCRSSNSSPTKAWTMRPRTIHLCCAAMSATG
jgi:hypothetical protein